MIAAEGAAGRTSRIMGRSESPVGPNSTPRSYAVSMRSADTCVTYKLAITLAIPQRSREQWKSRIVVLTQVSASAAAMRTYIVTVERDSRFARPSKNLVEKVDRRVASFANAESRGAHRLSGLGVIRQNAELHMELCRVSKAKHHVSVPHVQGSDTVLHRARQNQTQLQRTSCSPPRPLRAAHPLLRP